MPQPQIDDEFVKTIEAVLSGLDKADVNIEDLKNALINGGIPCTPEELDNRFKTYLKKVLNGKDPRRVRIIIN